MKSFTITRMIAAPTEKVWSTVKDFHRTPGPGVKVEMVTAGSGPEGAGAERTITIGSVKVRERLLSMGPGTTFTYRILAGAPMKDHKATATLAPNGTSTEIRWDVSFTPKVPGIGWIVAMVTKKAVNQYLDAVERSIR
ncbi:MAG: SRPBCC family protein [Nitrospiraceae bacterium]|nr:SRPBCC family protein [Nitrospiraceae bacterium]